MITKTGNWYDQSMDNSNNEWFYNIYILCLTIAKNY